jgi:hypothetical protein
MRRQRLLLVCTLACLSLAVPALGQEGHPLTGTWSGEWAPSQAQQNHVTLVMKWEGGKVTGLFNPGPNSFPITNAAVDVTQWTVRIEGDTKDQAGNAVHVIVDGRLADLESYHRTITGTWRQGNVQGELKLTRD